MMERLGCPDHHTLLNIPEERRSRLPRGEASCLFSFFLQLVFPHQGGSIEATR